LPGSQFINLYICVFLAAQRS